MRRLAEGPSSRVIPDMLNSTLSVAAASGATPTTAELLAPDPVATEANHTIASNVVPGSGESVLQATIEVAEEANRLHEDVARLKDVIEKGPERSCGVTLNLPAEPGVRK